MGRASNAQRAHPGKTCTECSKCKKVKGKEARNFIHVIDWKESDKKVLFEEFGLDSTCCLCDACRQFVKKQFKEGETVKSRKRFRKACFLSDYNKCEEQSFVETATGEWTHLAACLDLQTCSPPDSLPASIPLCNTHYAKLKSFKRQKCENCRRFIKGRARRCSNPELINKFNQEFGLDAVFQEDSLFCAECYHQHRVIVNREESLKSVSVKEELQDIVKKQEERAADITERDPPSFAISQAILFVGRHLLNSKPLLLKQAYQTYEKAWEEAWSKVDSNRPLIRTQHSVLIELLKVYDHHVTYSTKLSQRQHGTLLLRKGTDLRHVVHSLMVQSLDEEPPPLRAETSSKAKDISDKEILAKAAQLLNSELRRQSMEFSSKAPTVQNLTSFNVDQHIKEINPLLWNFIYLLTETTTEQRERDRCKDFDWSDHNGLSQNTSNRPSSLRRLYQLCHAMYAINDRCSYPLHLLLADTIQCQGGSQALLQILNRFGITSSRNVLDYHKNAIIMSNLYSMEEKVDRTSFAFTSIDNIDKGAPHAPVTADGKPRSVHGTSYQVVFPQPHTNENVGDDLIPCSTTKSQHHDPRNVTTKKILRDSKNLYRCLAVRNCASLRSCKRDEQGAPHDQTEREIEDYYAQLYKDDIIDCLISNDNIFMDELGTLLPISCLDITARIELLKKQSVIPGVIEAAAVSFLAKCPVYVYKHTEEGRYLYKEFGSCYSGVAPLQLLIDVAGFDLIVPNELVTSSYDLVTHESDMNVSVFRMWKDRNMYLLSGEQVEMSILAALEEGHHVENTDPKPSKLLKTKVHVYDIEKQREYRRHRYERLQRRARPTSHSLDDFKCSLEETQEEQLSVEKVLTYMLSKTDEETSSGNPTLKAAFAPEKAPEMSDIVYLGVLNEHADSIDTVLNVLSKIERQMKVGKRLKHMIVVGDGKTYCHLQQIKKQYPQEMEWMVPFPGDWHTLKNLQPVLMKIYWHAGLHSLAIRNHKGATLTSLAQCHHFKRTHNFLMYAWEALYRSQLVAFLNTNPEEKTEENLKRFSENLASQSDTYRLWHNFIHRDMMSYVMLFLGIRTGNWNLRVLALKKMAPLFHAYDRPMYLRIIPMHLHDILEMPPSLLDHLKKGGFSVSLSGLEGQNQGGDEAHETGINRDVKMALHRPDPSLMDRLSLYLPYRAMAQRNLREEVLPPSSRKHSTRRQHEANITLYMDTLSDSVVTQTQQQTTPLHTLITL